MQVPPRMNGVYKATISEYSLRFGRSGLSYPASLQLLDTLRNGRARCDLFEVILQTWSSFHEIIAEPGGCGHEFKNNEQESS